MSWLSNLDPTSYTLGIQVPSQKVTLQTYITVSPCSPSEKVRLDPYIQKYYMPKHHCASSFPVGERYIPQIPEIPSGKEWHPNVPKKQKTEPKSNTL